MSVLTLHPVPMILKEALGRAVGSELKRGGRSLIEGAGWDREKAGTHRRGALYPACTCSVPKWPMLALFPPFTPQLLPILAGSGWYSPTTSKGKEWYSEAWGRGHTGSASPELRPRPLARPTPLPGRLAGGGACAPGPGQRGDARAAASLRRSRRAEAVAADPHGLAVGGEPGARLQTSVFFFFVRGRGGRLNALNAQCTGCERPRWLCQKDPSAVDLSEGDTLPPGSAECGGGDGGSAGRTPGGAGGQ